MFNTLQFLKDYAIPHDPRHKSLTKNWIALKNCPFCGDRNYNFAMHETSGAGNCWKCEKHDRFKIIKQLTNSTNATAYSIIQQYMSNSTAFRHTFKREDTKEISSEFRECRLPKGTKPMIGIHRKYLQDRNFDDELLEQEWGLKGVGLVPGSSHNMRIIIPITHNNVRVSYQGRDVTGDKQRIRYKTCAKNDETRFHKHCLYGLDKIKHDSVVVTEGVTKVWRLGVGSVATFGIMWTLEQARLLINFKRVFILFDTGDVAQKKALELAELLSSISTAPFSSSTYTNTEIIELTGDIKDPGDLPQDEADYLMKELKIKG